MKKKSKFIVTSVGVLITGLSVVLFFQNCAPSKLVVNKNNSASIGGMTFNINSNSNSSTTGNSSSSRSTSTSNSSNTNSSNSNSSSGGLTAGSSSGVVGQWGPGDSVSSSNSSTSGTSVSDCAKIYGAEACKFSDSQKDLTVDSTSGMAINIVLEDSSSGNGSIVTEIDQKVTGAGISSFLRGCTAVVSSLKTSCTKVEDFSYLNYNGNNAEGPVGYFIVGNVSALNWPHTTYFSRFLAPDGSHVTKTWTPKVMTVTNLRVDSVSGMAVKINLVDNTKWQSGGILAIDQKTYGGGAGLRACTSTIQNLRDKCVDESEFVPMPGAYNQASDMYPTQGNIQNWPDTSYFTRYIAADGSHVTKTWSPTGVASTNTWGQ